MTPLFTLTAAAAAAAAAATTATATTFKTITAAKGIEVAVARALYVLHSLFPRLSMQMPEPSENDGDDKNDNKVFHHPNTWRLCPRLTFHRLMLCRYLVPRKKVAVGLQIFVGAPAVGQWDSIHWMA